MLLVTVCVATAALSLIYASEAEWWLHRNVMHQPLYIFGYCFDYPYKAHAKVHHRQFGWNASYHLGGGPGQEKDKIRMAWWNGPAIIVVGGMPWWIAALVLGYIWRADVGLAVAATCLVVWFGYYAAYESMHWCMHLPQLPKERWVESTWLFRFLNGHHLLHHYYPMKNLNVVLPLADWRRGILIRRAARAFDQPRGPAVPDVQPVPT